MSDPEVGEYLNRHCAATFEKTGTFTVAGSNKIGGNVATYFCTWDGAVLHCVAGQVDAATLRREAEWTVRTWGECRSVRNNVRAHFRRAHAERLRSEYADHMQPVLADPPSHMLASRPIPNSPMFLPPKLPMPSGSRGGSRAQKVHALMAAYAGLPLRVVFRSVFEDLLGERATTTEVVVQGRDRMQTVREIALARARATAANQERSSASSTPSSPYVRTDLTLTDKVRRALQAADLGPMKAIRPLGDKSIVRACVDGSAEVIGQVASAELRRRVEETVRGVEGVARVKLDRLTVRDVR